MSDIVRFPNKLPVIVESELFLYPFMITPIFLSADHNKQAAMEAIEMNLPVLVVTSKDRSENGEFYDSGVVGNIMRRVDMPDGRVKVLFQGNTRARIVSLDRTGFLQASVVELEFLPYDREKIEALLLNLKDSVKVLSNVTRTMPEDIVNAIDEKGDPNRSIDLIASTMRLKNSDAYDLLLEKDVEIRLLKLIEHIALAIKNTRLQQEIKTKVNKKIDKVNREYFLKEQLKQIRKELGEDTQRDEEIDEYNRKLELIRKKMPEEGYKETKKQIDRLSRMHPDSADANLLQTYIEWVLEMPFGKFSSGKLSVENVEKRLESDHYSLEKPKTRIVEFFAVRELLAKRNIDQKETRGTILCFAGPPGVGKTSLANSIAKALKRELVRVALGGMEDVNELRGHRRTYIGAMPGRLVQGLINAKSMDPVVVLDEIDKVGRNMRGDPTAALLEILDPEQNEHFRDYYLNFAIDLSRTIFIATANDLGSIPAPLRDRLEIIHLSSYTPQEKIEIAKRYLIPQELKKHGLARGEVAIASSAIRDMAEKYTREAGVRNLRRTIATVMRKAAKKLLIEELEKVSVSSKNLADFLDKNMIFEIEEAKKKNSVGIVNGLAWTSVGGDVLKIEAIKIRGKGVLQLTGSLGDVMKESVQIAFSVVKTMIDSGKLAVDQKLIPLTADEIKGRTKPAVMEVYNRHNLHVHVPEGATPKDGPSAGIAMATVIASILSQKEVRSDVAMTGELTLTGEVLTIGGLKEKLIAAHRAKMKTALIPKKNYEKDLDEIPLEVKNSLEIVPVTRVEEVLRLALVD